MKEKGRQQAEHRHSNSFTDDAVDAFQAMAKLAMQRTEFLAIMRRKGMRELLHKFGGMAEKSRGRRVASAEAAE